MKQTPIQRKSVPHRSSQLVESEEPKRSSMPDTIPTSEKPVNDKPLSKLTELKEQPKERSKTPPAVPPNKAQHKKYQTEQKKESPNPKIQILKVATARKSAEKKSTGKEPPSGDLIAQKLANQDTTKPKLDHVNARRPRQTMIKKRPRKTKLVVKSLPSDALDV